MQADIIEWTEDNRWNSQFFWPKDSLAICMLLCTKKMVDRQSDIINAASCTDSAVIHKQPCFVYDSLTTIGLCPLDLSGIFSHMHTWSLDWKSRHTYHKFAPLTAWPKLHWSDYQSVGARMRLWLLTECWVAASFSTERFRSVGIAVGVLIPMTRHDLRT